MRVIVVFESIWGNTERVARAIAVGLERHAPVELVTAEEAPMLLEPYDLVVVGGPTHAFSMSRPSTRASAVQTRNAPAAVSRGIREWLGEVCPVFYPIPAATFDTKVVTPRLPGSAAKAARSELRALGFDVSEPSKTFRVHGYGGPLVDGELDRAEQWGVALGALAATTVSGDHGDGESSLA
ncbi:MAG: flavodoxin domain-containing protein [Actinobacteria bacterium]|nr:flavodoxin domain-containing protein [Actinomycetota bacterium]MBU1608933.1 flavodoxin domain-containing protein [Actinomycetota bacterium]MBU2316374.1 flavodoxin domain-containing protein [Actinomycetota bacterium]MBU2384064.1 flavodoxin domain-containing protein [Actinomycetota bacterium]